MTIPSHRKQSRMQRMNTPKEGDKKPPHIKKKTAVAVLNIRLPEGMKGTLSEIAESYGVTTSEYVRALFLAEVRGWETDKHRFEVQKAVQESKTEKDSQK